MKTQTKLLGLVLGLIILILPWLAETAGYMNSSFRDNDTVKDINETWEMTRILDLGSAEETVFEEAKERRWDGLTIIIHLIGVYIMIELLGIIELVSFIIFSVRENYKARQYVLRHIETVKWLLEMAKEKTDSLDAGDTASKGLIIKLRLEFRSLTKSFRAKRNIIKWKDWRDKIKKIEFQAQAALIDIDQEISFAREAKEKGPELMKKLPRMLETAQKKLSQEKDMGKAKCFLKKAQEEYIRARREAESMETLNWTVLYNILTAALVKVEKAESVIAHKETRED